MHSETVAYIAQQVAMIRKNHMHGEYKVPGGKLIVVDLEQIDGKIAKFQLSGDFFLAPDEALTWITQALEGQAANSSETELSELVRQASGDAELIGITPEGVAIAIHRAINGGAA
jgi:lipoate-protein ligase A